MPGPALPALVVSESERRELEQLVKRRSTPQQTSVARPDYSPCQ